ncbi:putative protein [BD1-7 clade bacterium]|uniref:Metallo-beta-lactamase domain-containing protein n=1 Tax=BD1-7 clade bacterium TaxID=2029982 RepID=A0A5S9QQF0_9GAMM|nr:putative protein [BD1-7 clade bacterium]
MPLRFLFLMLMTLASLNAAALEKNTTEDCAHESLTLQVLGSGGPELDDGLDGSSYLVWLGPNAAVLVDTGPGSASRFGEVGARFETLEAILYSHLHVDHSADLPAYVKGSFFTPRDKNLLVIGPDGNKIMPSTSEFLKRLFGAEGAFSYLQGYLSSGKESYVLEGIDVPLSKGSVFNRSLPNGLNITAAPVNHGPIAAIGWRIQKGDCSMVFSGDTSNKDGALSALLIQGTDIFVAHNAVPEGTKGVARNLHMPPSEIGKLAAQANVRTLVLSHFMNRTRNNKTETLNAIRKFYTGRVIFAEPLHIVQ